MPADVRLRPAPSVGTADVTLTPAGGEAFDLSLFTTLASSTDVVLRPSRVQQVRHSLTTVTQPSAIDTRVDQANPTFNYGVATSLSATGHTAATHVVTHINFDTSMHANRAPLQVQLSLFITGIPSGNAQFDVYLAIANADWAEGTGNGSATGDGATYNTKDGVNAWAGGSNGGALDGTDIDAVPLGSIVLNTSMVADTEVLAGLDVSRITLGGTLHLVVVRNGSSTSTITGYRSKNSSVVTSRPRLVITSADSPAIAGIASSRATDTVAFVQCTYMGDTDGDEIITVKRKLAGANDETYVPLTTYYDRVAQIAYVGHQVNFGAGYVTHKGDIGLTPGTSYTYQFSFSGGSTPVTITQATLPRLDPLARTRPTRKAATAWFWNGSDTVAASVVRENAWIAMTKGDETAVSPSSLASLTTVRNGAVDIPIYQYFSIEIRRDLTDATYNLVWRRNSIIFDATLETDFEASFSEDWFIHNAGTAMADRIYNLAYSTFAINPTKPGLLSWVYKAILQTLYDRQTDATAAAVRFQGLAIDNMQHGLDGNWRTTATVNPVTPIETAYDTAAEIKAAWRAMYAYIKATGVYLATNVVNATTTDQTDDAALNILDGEFLESTVTLYSSIPGINYRTTTDWKAHIDTLIQIRDTPNGPDHLIMVVQIGTTPASNADAHFALWSYAMVADGTGAGSKVIVRPSDNADYDEDEVNSSGATGYTVDWGAPLSAYVQDTSVGSGDDRVYRRVFALGTVWFNPSAGSLSPTGGPTLAARTGQFVLNPALFTASLDGSQTSSGAIVKQANAVKAGTLTSSGALVKLALKPLTGTVTSSGGLVRRTNQVLAGTLTSAGALVKRASVLKAGTLTSAGTLAKLALKPLAGTLTSSGALVRRTNQVLAGTLTSAGALVKQANKPLAGTLTSSGALARAKVAVLALAGTLTSAGSLIKQARTLPSGAMTSAGTLTRRTNTALAGTLGSSGGLVRLTRKGLAGTLSSSGAVGKLARKVLAGVMASAGALARLFVGGNHQPVIILVAGSDGHIVSASGSVGNIITVAGSISNVLTAVGSEP